MSDATQPPDHSVSGAQQIDRLCDAFEAACKSGPPPRLEEFLDRAPAGQPDRLLRELLPIDIHYRVSHGNQPAAEDYVARFPSLDAAWVKQALAQQSAPLTAALQPSFQPDVIIAGRYTLKQKLGEGGMGEVWVAKQTEPVKRNVAIKLIKTGMDSRAVLARFEAERQALALMDHPNIARVLDGGITSSGQPFFVMELVNGLSVNKFCDESKLTVRQRLELFVPICQAVQHAHHKGIVHRDLKPSNILVTLIDGRPVPKVIDFGVAKATAGKLTEESLETQFGAIVGTLEYMAPEQAGYSGADIDTRADIYSLGIILYELLTGLRPLDAKRLKQAAYTEMIRIIKEEEPSKPSTRLSTDESLPSLAALRQTEPRKLMAALRGELDWVVMKCLEKDRNRRYETANGLARDIERYLSDEPVEARPPSTTYRLSKFLHRNKGPVIAASLVLLALLVGTVISAYFAFKERRRAIAESEQRARADSATERANLEAGRASLESEKAKAEAERASQVAEIATQQSKRAFRNYYVAMLSLTQRDWELGELGSIQDRLKAVQPEHTGQSDLRGFEWHYWNRLSHRVLATLPAARVFEMFPDGQRLAVASADARQIAIVDSASGVEQNRLSSDASSFLKRIAISPDGQRLAGGCNGGRVVVWKLSAQDSPLIFNGLRAVSNLVFHPDGVRMAAIGGDVLKVWDTNTSQEILSVQPRQSTFVGFVDDEGVASTTNTGMVETWNLASRELFSKVQVQLPQTAGNLVRGRAGMCTAIFSPDGRTLAGGCYDKSIRAWRPSNGEQVLDTHGHWAYVTYLRFSGDGSRLASAGYGDSVVKVWDARTSQWLFTFRRPHLDSVSALSFDQNGARLAVGYKQELVVYDAAKTQDSRVLTQDGSRSFSSVAFNRDGSLVAGRDERNRVICWNAGTGQLDTSQDEFHFDVDVLPVPQSLRQLAKPSSQHAFYSPDRKLVAVSGSDKSIHVWNAVDLTELLVLAGHGDTVTSVVFQPGNMRLASGDMDGVIKVWELIDGQEVLTLRGHRKQVNSLAFSPDGYRLASAGMDGTIRLWDATPRNETPTVDPKAASPQED